MPNYCWNVLNITGPEKDINEFLNKSKIKEDDNGYEKHFSFSGTVPEPDYKTTPVKLTYPEIDARHAKTDKEREEIMKNKPTIRKDSWWDWRVQNWGTKWEPIDPDVNYIKEGIVITFDSAWSPPIQWLHTVHLDYPDLKFLLEFEEPGMNFYGHVDAYGKNGIFDEFEDDLDKLHEEENLPVV